MSGYPSVARSRRVLSVLASFGMAVATLVAVPSTAQAAPTPAQAAEPKCEASAATADAAKAMAKACGKEVAVDSATTGFRQVFANADGSYTAKYSVKKQRVNRGGAWVPVDTGLARSGDWVTPKAADGDVKFSGGGNGPMVQFGAGSAAVEISAPWKLPAPQVSDATATYAEVLPGVDLVLEAHADGYSQLVVVKTAEAAKNKALDKLKFEVSVSGAKLAVNEAGGLEIRDSAGEVLFESGSSFMWDSKPVPEASESGADDGPVDMRPIAVSLSGNTLFLEPDLSLLRGADTVYPVVLDPTIGPKRDTFWTHVYSCGANSSYYGSYRTGMRVGHIWSDTDCRWRSFMQYDLEALDKPRTTVVAASLYVVADHVAACQGSFTQLWNTDAISNPGAFTWNMSAASGFYNGSALGEIKFDANEGTLCPKGDHGAWYGIPTDIAYNSLGTTLTLSLRAKYESDKYGWSYFYPSTQSNDALDPVLVIRYNQKPYTPTDLSPFGLVNTLQPTLSAKLTDPDGGGMLSATFEVTNSSGSVVATNSSAPTVVANGNTATWQVPSGVLSNGGTYSWKVKTTDEAVDGVSLTSDWSESKSITIDTSAPSVNSVTSSNCPKERWGVEKGQSCTFTFTGPADTKHFTWRVNSGNWQNAAATNGTGTVTFPTTQELVNTLSVTATDNADNTGSAVSFQFWVRPLGMQASCYEWTFNNQNGQDTGAGLPGCLAGGHVQRDATIVAPAAISADGFDAYGIGLTGTGGEVKTSAAVLDTSDSFTVMAWVNPSQLPGDQTVLSQEGNRTSRFELGYDADGFGGAPGWCMTLAGSDVDSTAVVKACTDVPSPDGSSSEPPTADRWVHLAGVYDAPNNKVKVYVMGDPDEDICWSAHTASADASGSWDAGGAFVIGRGKANGASARYLQGRVDSVYAYPKLLDPIEICQRARGNPTPAARVMAGYAFEDGAGPIATDSSGNWNDLYLSDESMWSADGRLGTGAVSLDGASGHLWTDWPVVLTEESFSVSAWVRPDSDADAVFLQQSGPTASSFKLVYDKETARLGFNTTSVDELGTVTWINADVSFTPAIGTWYHLVGVYDYVTGQRRLYINGVLAATKTGAPIQASVSGGLAVGSYWGGGGYLDGTLDSVWLYQGALLDWDVAELKRRG